MAIGAAAAWGAHLGWETWRARAIEALLVEQWQSAYRHARTTYARAHGALEGLNGSTLTPCSPAHAAFMRQVVMDNPAVEEVGYFQDGQLRCGSWGEPDHAIAVTAVDYLSPYQDRGTASLKPEMTGSGPLTGLARGNYNILINPSRLLRVDERFDVTLASAQGTVIASNSQTPSTMAHLQLRSGSVHGRRFLRAPLGSAQLIVSAPMSQPLPWTRPGWHWLIGAVMAAAAAFALSRLQQRDLAPHRHLARALKSDTLYLQFQAIVDMRINQCVGAEALLRWPLPDGSHVSPEDFIDLAQQHDLLPAITRHVITRALQDMAPTLCKFRHAHVTLNLGAQDLETMDVVQHLEACTWQLGIEPRQVWLEVTERAVLNIERAAPTIEALHQLGYIIALDDFGTGYSGLHNLQLLPVSVVKLDRVFVSQMRSAEGITLTDDIIQFVQARGLILVAEGVETTSQRAHLLQHNVAFGQGWLFGRPEPAERIAARIRAGRPAVAPTPPPAFDAP